MLTLHPEQFARLTADAEDRFCQRLGLILRDVVPADAARLAEHYVGSTGTVPDAVGTRKGDSSADRLTDFVRDALALAAEAEVDEAGDQAALICLLAMEERYESANAAVIEQLAEILDRDDPGHVRLAMIEGWLSNLAESNAGAAEILEAMRTTRETI